MPLCKQENKGKDGERTMNCHDIDFGCNVLHPKKREVPMEKKINLNPRISGRKNSKKRKEGMKCYSTLQLPCNIKYEA